MEWGRAKTCTSGAGLQENQEACVCVYTREGNYSATQWPARHKDYSSPCEQSQNASRKLDFMSVGVLSPWEWYRNSLKLLWIFIHLKTTQCIKIYKSKCLKEAQHANLYEHISAIIFQGDFQLHSIFKLHVDIFNDPFFLEHVGSSSLEHVGSSSLTRVWTWAPCIGSVEF